MGCDAHLFLQGLDFNSDKKDKTDAVDGAAEGRRRVVLALSKRSMQR